MSKAYETQNRLNSAFVNLDKAIRDMEVAFVASTDRRGGIVSVLDYLHTAKPELLELCRLEDAEVEERKKKISGSHQT